MIIPKGLTRLISRGLGANPMAAESELLKAKSHVALSLEEESLTLGSLERASEVATSLESTSLAATSLEADSFVDEDLVDGSIIKVEST